MVGSIPFTYKALMRYRVQREEEAARQEDAAANKGKRPPKPHKTLTTPPASQLQDRPVPSSATEPKWESPLDALARLRNQLKSGKRNEFPVGTVRHGDCHYLLVTPPMTWIEAAGFAENHGGHLVVPSDTDDLRWLAGQTGDVEWSWLGVGKNSTGEWLFVDGNPWNLGTPPLGQGAFATINHFGVLKSAAASQRLPFLIQWHHDGSNPVNFGDIRQRFLHSEAAPPKVTKPPTPTEQSAPMPEEAVALEPRAKQLIAAAVKERDDQLIANAKQFGWDIDTWVRSLPKADLAVWGSEAAAFKLLVRDNKYVPEELPQSGGIRLSPQMAKVATYCADKQKSIDAGYLAKARKIHEAYVAKLDTLAKVESEQGHSDNADRLHDMESAAADLKSWVKSLGYPLRQDFTSLRR
jgi:hypothetical protein